MGEAVTHQKQNLNPHQPIMNPARKPFAAWLAAAVTTVALLSTSLPSQAGWGWWRHYRPAPDLVTKLEQQGKYTTLLTALELTGLKETVATADALTIFAPTDDAFAALPDGTLEALIADPDTLTQILLYHVVGGKQSASELLRQTTATTLQGAPVLVTYEHWQARVNGHVIRPANLRAKNGFIHSIGSVLIPPAGDVQIASILDVLRLDGRFSTLLTALELTGLDGAVADSPSLSLFAPTDEAFAALPSGTLDALIADPDLLAEILLYHVTGQASGIHQLYRMGSVETLQGGDVRVGFRNWKFTINDAAVLALNVRAPNGIIQVIDQVLVPPTKPASLLELLKADGRFTTLVAALEAAGLDGALSGDTPLTVFAPTDDAFSRLPSGTVEALLADPDTLANILLYHVVPGDRDLHSLRDERRVETLNGQSVHIWRLWHRYFFVNRAYIQQSDLMADNGRAHVITRVLLPPTSGGGDDEEDDD
ncbi:MAG TPA: adhesion lipoprotein [Verrucomicrobiales bacterium]|nr:adhesion lipoprotein [Verrucomicrobiales bacterium]